MCAENLDWLVAVALDELLARLGRHRGIGVELADPFGMGDLDWMMNHVAGDHRVLAVRGNPHAGMARSMAGGGLEPAFARQLAGRFDQLRETSLDYRAHRVFDRLLKVGTAVV